MTFDELLETGRGANELVIPESWAQGRASFGGVVAGLVFDRMQRQVAPGRPMRALQVSFVGPVVPGKPMTVTSELLREGKSASQTLGRISQGDATCVVATANFGADRESVVQVSGRYPAPDFKAPEDSQPIPQVPGVTPPFTQHIEARWAVGSVPFTGCDSLQMGGWMRFTETPESISDAHLVALVDAWPPAVLPMLRKPAPASTLSWSLDVLHPRPEIRPGEWLMYLATVDQAEAGYGHTQAQIWNKKGELVALSRQTVTVFG
ncbi:MAG TPA: acyl-CoA thioesterase II [Marinobacter sp.]|jgi:acyl-CoA thioesterase|nr:acyl-CoA thioesterase II [Marinobacter sp.]